MSAADEISLRTPERRKTNRREFNCIWMFVAR